MNLSVSVTSVKPCPIYAKSESCGNNNDPLDTLRRSMILKDVLEVFRSGTPTATRLTNRRATEQHVLVNITATAPTSPNQHAIADMGTRGRDT